MNLRLVQGPLPAQQNDAILIQYNELSSSRVPKEEFLHWIQNSPAGPARHAILENDDGEIVGHTCLIPFSGSYKGRKMVAAKSEYGFIREEYRTRKVRGFETMTRPRQMIMIEQLFRHCLEQGWGPLVISTSRALRMFGRRIGCYPTDFPLWECLLVLRPWSAGRSTPNLNTRQKVLMWIAGAIQRMMWDAVLMMWRRASTVRSIPTHQHLSEKINERLCFFEDGESQEWRYPAGQYERLAADPNGSEYVIVRKALHDFVRVCQWRLGPKPPSFTTIADLVRMAKTEGTLGLRWAVYGQGEEAKRLVRQMRRLGFVCQPRVRTLLISTEEEELLLAEKWDLNDAMFSFHNYQVAP